MNEKRENVIEPVCEATEPVEAQQRDEPDIRDNQGEPEYEMELILSCKVGSNRSEDQYLVKWKGFPTEQATWESGSEMWKTGGAKHIEDYKHLIEERTGEKNSSNLNVQSDLIRIIGFSSNQSRLDF